MISTDLDPETVHKVLTVSFKRAPMTFVNWILWNFELDWPTENMEYLTTFPVSGERGTFLSGGHLPRGVTHVLGPPLWRFTNNSTNREGGKIGI